MNEDAKLGKKHTAVVPDPEILLLEKINAKLDRILELWDSVYEPRIDFTDWGRGHGGLYKEASIRTNAKGDRVIKQRMKERPKDFDTQRYDNPEHPK